MELDIHRRPATPQPKVETPVVDAKEGARRLAMGLPAEPTAQERDAGTGQFAAKPKTLEETDAEWFAKAQEGLKAGAVDGVVEEQAPDAKAKADAPEQADESKAEDVDKDALAAAMLDARRLKIPAKALDAMSPSEIVQAGRDWKAQVSENGKLSQKFGELEKQIEAMKASQVAASGKPDQPAKDLDTDVQPLLADYDESTRKSLTGLTKYSIEQAKTAAREIVKAEIAELLKAANVAAEQQRAHAEVRDSVLGELEGKVPQLGKASVKTAVLKRAESFAQLPDFKDDYEGALRLAVKAECASFEPAVQSSESTSGKRNGVASTNSQAPRPKVKTAEDVDRLAYFGRTG